MLIWAQQTYPPIVTPWGELAEGNPVMEHSRGLLPSNANSHRQVQNSITINWTHFLCESRTHTGKPQTWVWTLFPVQCHYLFFGTWLLLSDLTKSMRGSWNEHATPIWCYAKVTEFWLRYCLAHTKQWRVKVTHKHRLSKLSYLLECGLHMPQNRHTSLSALT